MNIRTEIGIILLAAGASTRMGQPKQLLPFKGETLIRHTAKVALQTTCRPVVIVIPLNQPLFQKELEDLNVILVESEDAAPGMSTSIHAGLVRMQVEAPQCLAILFLVVDQPFINAAHLTNLVNASTESEKSIVASAYKDQLGVPALFDKKWFPALMQLTGDQGARKLLKAYPDEVHAISFPEGAFDLDTPENYDFLIAHFE